MMESILNEIVSMAIFISVVETKPMETKSKEKETEIIVNFMSTVEKNKSELKSMEKMTYMRKKNIQTCRWKLLHSDKIISYNVPWGNAFPFLETMHIVIYIYSSKTCSCLSYGMHVILRVINRTIRFSYDQLSCIIKCQISPFLPPIHRCVGTVHNMRNSTGAHMFLLYANIVLAFLFYVHLHCKWNSYFILCPVSSGCTMYLKTVDVFFQRIIISVTLKKYTIFIINFRR